VLLLTIRSTLAVSGQSCCGLEALSAAYKEDRVKNIVLWNSGVIDGSKRRYLADLKVPLAYFVGGLNDIEFQNVSIHMVTLCMTTANKVLSGRG